MEAIGASINDNLPLRNSRISTYRILTTEELPQLNNLIKEVAF
jgi:hypothetical protein